MLTDDEVRPGEGVGRRVRAARQLAGWTQDKLARQASVSGSLVRQVEQGRVPASPAFVAATARALGVGPAELMEQPAAPETAGEHRLHAHVPPLRRELTSFSLPPDDCAPRPRPLPDLTAGVCRLSELRHAADLAALGAELPGLLAELRAATHTLTGSERERAFGLLAEAYYAADQLASKLGYTDLASMAVDRYEWSASQSGDELAVLVGDYRRAGELIGSADWTAARRLLDRSRSRIAAQIADGDEATLSVWGNLHLKSGLAAARSGDRDGADAHLDEARETAARIGRDRDDYRLWFGPTNVAMWSVGLAVEGCDGTEGVKRAETVRLPDGAPSERIGHHWIDTARASLLHGDWQRSLDALQRARTTSPQQTRYHPQVRETVRVLAETDRRRTDTLAGFARWAGIRV